MNAQFEHIDVTEFNGFSIIESNDVIGLVRLAEFSNVKFIFRKGAKDKESASEDFFFHIGNIIYKIKANDFLSLNDYCNATVKKFPTAQDYYEAKKKGFDLFEDYKHSRSAGGAEKEVYEEAKSAGFVRGFDSFQKKYSKYKSFKHTNGIPTDLDSPIKLYQYATNRGFHNYNSFETAYDAGYPEMTVYNEATTKGFKSADDFFDAMSKGFVMPTEYEIAKEKRISSKKEYDDYCFLKSGNYRNFGFDEFQLLQLMKGFDNGKKISLKELREILLTNQEKYKRAFNGNEIKILPLWYIQKISTDEQLHEFLRTNSEIKKLGTYNEKEKTFEIFVKNRTKVYVDASNVAHNTSNSKTVLFRNLRLVVQDLINVWKFPEVIVIADANLKHKAKDTDELDRVKKIAEYYEVPSHTAADKFLLDLIHHEKCIIVSNDTFRDWQQKDFWLRTNIDNIRVPFFIKGDQVILHGIENHLPKSD
jgi:hypothetical protein